jgi:preprotein translocase subunit SecD
MRKKLLLSLLLSILFLACSRKINQPSGEIASASLEKIYKENISSSTLQTGWYYVLQDTISNFARGLKETRLEFSDAAWLYYLDPHPVIIKKHFKHMNILKSYTGRYYQLLIKFDNEGTKLWSDATAKSIDRKVAFIMNDSLINVVRISAQIKVGKASVVGKKEEMIQLKKQLGF